MYRTKKKHSHTRTHTHAHTYTYTLARIHTHTHTHIHTLKNLKNKIKTTEPPVNYSYVDQKRKTFM